MVNKNFGLLIVAGIAAVFLLTNKSSADTSTSSGGDTGQSGYTGFNDALSKSPGGDTYVYNVPAPNFPTIAIPPVMDLPKDTGGNIPAAASYSGNQSAGGLGTGYALTGGYGALQNAAAVGARAPTVLNSAKELVHAPAPSMLMPGGQKIPNSQSGNWSISRGAY